MNISISEMAYKKLAMCLSNNVKLMVKKILSNKSRLLVLDQIFCIKDDEND